MTALEIYGFAQSTYVRTALAVCREKGAPATLKPLDFRAPSHLALHPFARMPAMRHGAVTLFETAAIVAYVDAAFAGPRLIPADAAGAGLVWQWASATVDYIAPALVYAALKEGGPDEAERALAARALDALEAALAAGDYLAGDAVTAADLFVAPAVGFRAAAERDGPALLAGHPRLAAWLARIGARDSLKEAA